MELESELTRENVINFLSSSVIYGNLGLFIGAGFSKAVLHDESGAAALSWGELIEATSKELGIDYTSINKVGISYPEISTIICDQYAIKEGIEYEEAKSKFKSIVCGLTTWYPNKEQRKEFSEYLEVMDPKWVITTNYDLVIESLLTGRCLSLSPEDYITSPKNVIPVYHLHGIRHNPESIIITQEDYVKLFRPNEYRQIKLALTIKESTTLILGYGLGDVNVLSAVDWSNNIYEYSNIYPHDIVQVVRSANPNAEPYRDKNNIIIIETNEIKDFLAEFNQVLVENIHFNLGRLAKIEELNGELTTEEYITKFISDQKFRFSMLKILADFEIHMISQFIDFLSRCIDKTWENSKPFGAFEGYNQNLTILLDIIINIEFKKMPPALFEFVAYSLDRVFYYVGSESGKSHSAARTWNGKRNLIPQEIVLELHKQKQFPTLRVNLNPIIERIGLV